MIQRLRLLSGLVLFSYVTSHLLNHALGMVSLDAAEAGRWWFTGFWRSALGTILLYPCLLGHVGLALWAIYQRRHLRLPAWEIVRLLLGLLIPVMLIPHVFGTRVANAALGVADTYSRQILSFWVLNPTLGIQQMALLLVAWAHGWLGVYHWLAVQPLPRLTLSAFRVVGYLVPLFALMGYFDMGREVNVLATNPAWVQRVYPSRASTADSHPTDSYPAYPNYDPSYEYSADPYLPPAATARVDPTTLEHWKYATMAIYIAGVLATFGGRQVRAAWQRRGGLVRLTYPDGRRVAILPGTTILEASRLAGIPHASLCGGRGRCSTCRTRIGAGLDTVPPPSAAEARVLKRIEAPPNVRLACQTRPLADLDVFPLLPVTAGASADAQQAGPTGGSEREIAILFCDMRSFTRFAEHRLPYDVVFLLNQFSDAMGRAIERAGGYPNQFVGDGLMALFGLDSGPASGCREALHAAVGMARALENLNRVLAQDLKEPLRIGIGIHTGHVIVGEMGYGQARYLTAIGDAVNTASRLETLTKEYDCQLVVSESVAARAGVDLKRFPLCQIQVRGRTDPLEIHVVGSARDLVAVLAPPALEPA